MTDAALYLIIGINIGLAAAAVLYCLTGLFASSCGWLACSAVALLYWLAGRWQPAPPAPSSQFRHPIATLEKL